MESEQQKQMVQTIIRLISERFDIEYDDIMEFIEMKVDFKNYSVKQNKIFKVEKITTNENQHVYFDMRRNLCYDSEKRETDVIAVE